MTTDADAKWRAGGPKTMRLVPMARYSLASAVRAYSVGSIGAPTRTKRGAPIWFIGMKFQ